MLCSTIMSHQLQLQQDVQAQIEIAPNNAIIIEDSDSTATSEDDDSVNK